MTTADDEDGSPEFEIFGFNSIGNKIKNDMYEIRISERIDKYH